MQTRNPVLSRLEHPEKGSSGFAFDEGRSAYDEAGRQVKTETGTQAAPQSGSPASTRPVTLGDVINKTSVLLFILIVFAVGGWQVTPSMPWLVWVSMFIGLGLGIANALMREIKPALVLLYAAVQGVFLGGISYWYDNWVQTVNPEYTGLVSQAIIGTLVAFGVMLALYSGRIIKVNGKFARIMTIAIISYALIALVSFVAALFGVGGGWGFYGVGTLGLILCGIGVLLAAFSLNLDFAAIEQGVKMGLPEKESWRMSFGLLVTLIWLYIEILRLLSILAMSRD